MRSSDAERFSSICAPASAWCVDGGTGVHRSSQISMAEVKHYVGGEGCSHQCAVLGMAAVKPSFFVKLVVIGDIGLGYHGTYGAAGDDNRAVQQAVSVAQRGAHNDCCGRESAGHNGQFAQGVFGLVKQRGVVKEVRACVACDREFGKHRQAYPLSRQIAGGFGYILYVFRRVCQRHRHGDGRYPEKSVSHSRKVMFFLLSPASRQRIRPNSLLSYKKGGVK